MELEVAFKQTQSEDFVYTANFNDFFQRVTSFHDQGNNIVLILAGDIKSKILIFQQFFDINQIISLVSPIKGDGRELNVNEVFREQIFPQHGNHSVVTLSVFGQVRDCFHGAALLNEIELFRQVTSVKILENCTTFIRVSEAAILVVLANK